MFRMAFHGGFGNVWSALMTIPEARQVKRCMNKQESCLTYEVIRKEAGGTGENEKPRIIVNPDFVEQMVSVNSNDAKISSIFLFFIRAFSFTGQVRRLHPVGPRGRGAGLEQHLRRPAWQQTLQRTEDEERKRKMKTNIYFTHPLGHLRGPGLLHPKDEDFHFPPPHLSKNSFQRREGAARRRPDTRFFMP